MTDDERLLDDLRHAKRMMDKNLAPGGDRFAGVCWHDVWMDLKKKANERGLL